MVEQMMGIVDKKRCTDNCYMPTPLDLSQATRRSNYSNKERLPGLSPPNELLTKAERPTRFFKNQVTSSYSLQPSQMSKYYPNLSPTNSLLLMVSNLSTSRTKLLPAIIFLLCSFGLSMSTVVAQNGPQASEIKGGVKGTLIDATTDEPLGFANVVIYTFEGSLVSGTTTDIDGKFEISNIPLGDYRLEASFIGYGTENLNVELNDIDRFFHRWRPAARYRWTRPGRSSCYRRPRGNATRT